MSFYRLFSIGITTKWDGKHKTPEEEKKKKKKNGLPILFLATIFGFQIRVHHLLIQFSSIPCGILTGTPLGTFC